MSFQDDAERQARERERICRINSAAAAERKKRGLDEPLFSVRNAGAARGRGRGGRYQRGATLVRSGERANTSEPPATTPDSNSSGRPFEGSFQSQGRTFSHGGRDDAEVSWRIRRSAAESAPSWRRPVGDPVLVGTARRPPPFGEINQPPVMFGTGGCAYGGRRDHQGATLRAHDKGATPYAVHGRGSPAILSRLTPRGRLWRQPSISSASTDSVPESLSEEDKEAPPLSDVQVELQIQETVKELFAIRDLDEASLYFSALPQTHHAQLVDRLVKSH
ncbi:hypothetical protein HGRIS_000310 [Hohenbuehelia grisea]|uniref:Uncharacterized protein n=1 Tax=Hohenbuehelia grisea TaxID=104357 RepID=A0ABR3JQP3_9AGAR